MEEVGDLFDKSFSSSAKGWARGKSEQEIAKAWEIKTNVVEKLGQLELARRKQVMEREALERQANGEDEKMRLEHERKLYELRTQRLHEIAHALKTFKELGMEADLTLVKNLLGQIEGESKKAKADGSLPQGPTPRQLPGPE